MKDIVKKSLRSLLIVPALALSLGVLAPVTPVGALGISDGAGSAKGDDQSDCLFGTEASCTDEPIFKTITNVLLFIIGAISVIMLIIGGIRYTVSGGDSGAVTSAKNTILYAIVGIIVAILAFAVVNWVIGSFTA
jgi:hypothetical protein